MAKATEPRMTLTEFLGWNDGTDTRYELDHGVPVAMTPPLGAHRAIAVNTATVVNIALRGRGPCRAEAEAGISRGEDSYWQADIAVTCTPQDKEALTKDPLLVVEILSPSTRRHDLGDKLPDYQAIGSIREIWLVDSARRHVQHWSREADLWIVRDLVAGATFESPVLATTIELDRLYEGTEV